MIGHSPINISLVIANNNLTPAMEQQLEQLRDIHLPEPVSWFPMAIGWWLLISCLIIALIIIYRKIKAHRRIYKHPAYLSALDELSQLKHKAQDAKDNNAKLAGDLSALLKRVGLYHHLPIATLSGDEWANYLTQSTSYLTQSAAETDTDNETENDTKRKVRFSQEQASFIANGAYAPSSAQVPDWQALESTARDWITFQFEQAAKSSHSFKSKASSFKSKASKEKASKPLKSKPLKPNKETL